MIVKEQISIKPISSLLNSNELSLIPLIDSLIITDKLWGKVDEIINNYYPDNLEYLPLLLAFNNISDISEINIGMILEIPDFDSYLKSTYINDILDTDNIPGINSSMNSDKSNIDNLKTKQSENKTIASPKLNIILNQITYNRNTGEITI